MALLFRCELRDPSGGCVADIAWNPDQGLHIITASGDDKNPVLKLWDLRSSTSLPLATLQGGHTEGVLSVSWCPTDTSLILSCGKDNKTILWDLYHLQPVYELPFKDASSQGGSFAHDQDANVFGGFASSASHRRYHVSWSPCLPAVTSASSFDRKVQFFSMTGARSKLGRAPKWLRRPVGATFGFGGKLVTINNIQTSVGQNPKKPNAGGKLKVFQISENPELTASSELFNEAVTKGQLKQYCESKCAQHGGSPTGEVWNLMKVICFGSNAREELLTYLGFDSVSINAHAQTYLATHQLSSLSQQDSNAHNVFGGALETDAKTALDLASLSSMESSRLADLYDTMKSAEKAEPTIREAIIVGNFEMAVDCCLKAGLLAEALLLAQCGGQELRIKTQAAFFERQRHIHPFLNVLHAVIKNQLLEFVMSSDLKRWRETLALLSTYGKSEEFTSLCEALANRLENEVQDKRSASLCYMCATNVQRTVQFWTEELQTANAVTGQLDTLALQEYVEKVMVFTQANPTDNLGSECGQFFARYGELLASQGRLSNAAIYLKGESQPVKILLDRLYHAGNKPPGSRPPVFPFNKVNIEMASSGHAENNVSAVPLAATTVKDVRGAPNPRAVVNARVDPKPVASSATNSANVPTPLTPTASAPSLPPGWLQLVDPASNLPYYVNQATGQSQWEPPVVAQAPVAVAPVPVPSTIPSANQSYQSFDQQHVQAQSISQQAMSQPAQSQPVQSIPSVSSGPGLGSPEADCVIAIGQMIEAIAVSNLTPAEKKQIAMLRQAYSHLNDKLKVGEVSIDILQKLASLTDHLCNRNYAAASAIQTVSFFYSLTDISPLLLFLFIGLFIFFPNRI